MSTATVLDQVGIGLFSIGITSDQEQKKNWISTMLVTVLNVDILPSFAHLSLLLGSFPCCTCTTVVSQLLSVIYLFLCENPPRGCSDSLNGDDNSY